MKRMLLVLITITVIYLLFCLLLYFGQERLLFLPTKLPADYRFNFQHKFEEISLPVETDVKLSALLFKADSAKGVVFFLHGNAGSNHSWGTGADLYLSNGYDVFYLDYRGYGKSNGTIESEEQLISDAQIAYIFLKDIYTEQRIIVSGTSIGSGIAVQIAAKNQPHALLLNSPYYSLLSLAKESVPIIPELIIRYRLESYLHLKTVQCHVTIFHGVSDRIIPLKHSIKLTEMYSEIDFVKIENYGHNDLTNSPEYKKIMKQILE